MAKVGKIIGWTAAGVATGGLALVGAKVYKKRKKIKMEQEELENASQDVTMIMVEENEQDALEYVKDSELYKKDPEAYKNVMAGIKTINEMKADNKRVEIEKKKAEDEKACNKKTFVHRVLVDGVWITLTTALAWFGFAFEQTGSMSSKSLSWIHQRFPKRFGTLN